MPNKKDDILAAAMVVFREEGLKGARMERIAQEAQVSKRTLYKYFDSKEALFEAISANVVEILSDMEIPQFDQTQAVAPQLTEALRIYINQTLREDFLNGSRVILAEFMRNPEAAKRFNDAYLGVDATISRFIAQAAEAGLLNIDDIEGATSLLLALYKSSLLMPRILNNVGARGSGDIERLIEESVQVFLNRYMSKGTQVMADR
ncbi:TetR/AcrR family transcriptional regulator [Shimia marina]|uniref:Rut operon repressor n=1 Tax=Shimia marina TaxID=321267 RepID=A0A0P1EQH2_9RHOB|nr:TetR/AcrR family transcriptional regulator [Shimia marina]CUH52710.1 Rut operon repressor [Shimia marina]SFE81959.1 transcriptional regulator, TetR family [Shimia marina]